MVELRPDLILGDGLANVEASAAGADIPLSADIMRFFFPVLIQSLGGRNGEITVFQRNLDIFLLEAGQIHFQLIAVILLLDVSGHHSGSIVAVELFLHVLHSVIKEREVAKEIIKQVLIVNTGHQHNNSSFCSRVFFASGGAMSICILEHGSIWREAVCNPVQNLFLCSGNSISPILALVNREC